MATSALLLLLIGAVTVNAGASYSNSKIIRKNTTSTCIFFTAPHSIYINAERFKKAETNTDKIVKTMASHSGGGYATWRADERDEADAIWKHDGWTDDKKKRELEKLGNHDPNYLDNENRNRHGWMKYLRQARVSCMKRALGDRNRRGMHLDIHGMSDATAARIGEHLVIGTKAMETTQNWPRKYDETKSKKFRDALKRHLKTVLLKIQNYNGLGRLTIKTQGGVQLPVRAVRGWEPTTCDHIMPCTTCKTKSNGAWIPDPNQHKAACDVMKKKDKLSERNQAKKARFVGDWKKQRNTLSRISTEKALWAKYGRKDNSEYSRGKVKPFGCAVQIEMSAQLRALLVRSDNNFAKEIARALKKVYKDAKCSYEDGPVSRASYLRG
jgi:hypothetical protein